MTSSCTGLTRYPGQPAFVIGVTGHIDLDPDCRGRVEADLITIFRWLIDPSVQSSDEKYGALRQGLGLKETPLLLLSSLAPGADQWAVEAFQKYHRDHEHPAGILILAPLPFVKDQYLESTSFKRNGSLIDEEASEFLRVFPDEQTFVVRLAEDVDLDSGALRAKHQPILSGTQSKKERNERYSAAGEYIAAYSDLLIALTDTPPGEMDPMKSIPRGSPGARAIAEVKRRGVTSALLPHLPTLSWADSGPVVHIYAPRRSAGKTGSGSGSGTNRGERLKIYYAYDCCPTGVSETDATNEQWQEAGHGRLKAITDHLKQLNEEKGIDESSEKADLAAMLWGSEGEIHGIHPLFKEKLERLAHIRQRLASLSMHYQGVLRRSRETMFWLALGVALFFAAAEGWREPASFQIRVLYTLVAVACGATILFVFYVCLAKNHVSERYDEYRAAAEGLRAQVYWTASGSGCSVCSRYLQRQLGELGWIRNAIRSVSFPYDQDRMHFRQLAPESQIAMVNLIRENWLKRQAEYFETQRKELTRDKHLFSTGGTVLLLTGFLLQLSALVPPGGWEVLQSYNSMALLLIFTGLVIVIAASDGASPVERPKETKTQSAKLDNPKSKPVFRTVFLGFLKRLARSPMEGILAKRTLSLPNGRMLLVALLTVALVLLIVGTSSLFWKGLLLPGAERICAILKNISFAGSVLCGAWIEFNFYEENLRRYESMATLFQTAERRCADHLDWLQSVFVDERISAHSKAIANIQELMVGVGSEALSENSEWLIAHRTRPPEPISPF
jgi:hypothetical protein